MAFTLDNFVRSTLQANITAGATTITVTLAAPPLRNPPAASAAAPGLIVLQDAPASPSKIEIVSYTGRSIAGTVVTLTGVARGLEGTTASPWTAGTPIFGGMTAGVLSSIVTDAGFVSDLDGLRGSCVFSCSQASTGSPSGSGYDATGYQIEQSGQRTQWITIAPTSTYTRVDDSADASGPWSAWDQVVQASAIGSAAAASTADFDAAGAASTALTAAQDYADGKVIDSIADGDTAHAPSRNAVFDALAGKLDSAAIGLTATGLAQSGIGFNAIAKSGFYRPNLDGGEPLAAADHDVLHIQAAGGDASQLAFTSNANVYFRVKDDGSTWGTWTGFWHSGNFNPDTKLSTTATAAAATKLATARTIAGKSFDGTANISISASDIGAATSAQGALAASALQPGAGLSSLDSSAATKLAGIAVGAEANVNADWNAASGDAKINNKPTLGTAAAQDTSAFATSAQGSKADAALQPNTNVTVSRVTVSASGEAGLDLLSTTGGRNVRVIQSTAGNVGFYDAAAGRYLMLIAPDDDVSFRGAITASNFSGSSSGANTGDQDLSGLLPKSNLSGFSKFAVVTSMPGSPDANTLYFVK